MRELHYGAGILIVGREVCTTVFDYALTLARTGRSDLITVPVLVNGRLDESTILLSPTSQIFCTPAIETNDQLDDPAVVAELRQRIEFAQHPMSAVVDDATAYPDFEYEYE
jgi:hypothetical protein